MWTIGIYLMWTSPTSAARSETSTRTKKLRAGRGWVGKTVVGGVRDRPSNRISAEILPGTKKGTSEGFVGARASPDAVVFTDDLASYNRVPNRFRVNHSTGEYVDGMLQVNGEQSFWALLKRGYYGTRPRVGDGLWREHGCEAARRPDGPGGRGARDPGWSYVMSQRLPDHQEGPPSLGGRPLGDLHGLDRFAIM